MIVVYWRVGEEVTRFGNGVPGGTPITAWDARMQSFDATALGEALKFAEALRAKRKAGELISHVCMQSEMPESVGQAGVSDPSKDYDWRKRREDPATFGRDRPGDENKEDLV